MFFFFTCARFSLALQRSINILKSEFMMIRDENIIIKTPCSLFCPVVFYSGNEKKYFSRDSGGTRE